MTESVMIICVGRPSQLVGPAAFGPPGTLPRLLLHLAQIGMYDVHRHVGAIDRTALRSLRSAKGAHPKQSGSFEPCAVLYRLMMTGNGHLLSKPTTHSSAVVLTLVPWVLEATDDIVWWVKYAEGHACQVTTSLLPHRAVKITHRRTPTPLTLDGAP